MIYNRIAKLGLSVNDTTRDSMIDGMTDGISHPARKYNRNDAQYIVKKKKRQAVDSRK